MEEKKTQTKVCNCCGRELPVDQFGKHAKTKDGLQPICKECRSKIQKEAAARKKAETVEPTPDEEIIKMRDKAEAEFKEWVEKGAPDLPKPELKHIPTLAGFDDDDLISELVDRGWTGRITKTITVSYHISPDGIKVE